MNERSATTRSTGAPSAPASSSRRFVRSITVTRVVPQRPRELPAADIDRDHLGRPRLQQAVGEPAGRRPGVEHAQPGDVDRELVERAPQLVAAARHVLVRRGGDRDGFGTVDLTRRAVARALRRR